VGVRLDEEAGHARPFVQGVWIHRDRIEVSAELHPIPDRIIGHLDELRAALSEVS
jgi:hypothetical protein